jgi:hypothetical protein
MSFVLMAHEASAPHKIARILAGDRPGLSGVEVLREGRVEPLPHAHATLTSAAAQWWAMTVDSPQRNLVARISPKSSR